MNTLLVLDVYVSMLSAPNGRLDVIGNADDWRELTVTLESCGLVRTAQLARSVLISKETEYES